MKLSAPWRTVSSSSLILAALVLASTALAVALDYSNFGEQFDKYAYDFLFRLEQPKPWQPNSIILAIDEQTLAKYGGQPGIRAALADGLEKIAPAHPLAVAVDVILAERGTDEAGDRALENAFADTPHLI